MCDLERLQILAECMNSLVQYNSRVVIELTHSPFRSGNFYLLRAHVKQDFFYSTEIELFFSALDVNLGLLKKYILKMTPINHIYQNTLKTGYIFRK